MFNVVPGLDGKPGSVSLELGSKPGCFLVASASTKVQVGCRSRGSDGEDNSVIGNRHLTSFNTCKADKENLHPSAWSTMVAMGGSGGGSLGAMMSENGGGIRPRRGRC
uniref:Uncharacterized protein n=1 Tax=Oryza nivara TaxID=4536 RepID=A0A0E0FKA4_ORYNI